MVEEPASPHETILPLNDVISKETLVVVHSLAVVVPGSPTVK